MTLPVKEPDAICFPSSIGAEEATPTTISDSWQEKVRINSRRSHNVFLKIVRRLEATRGLLHVAKGWPSHPEAVMKLSQRITFWERLSRPISG